MTANGSSTTSAIGQSNLTFAANTGQLVLSNTNAGVSPAYTITGGALSAISEYAVVACNAYYSSLALAGDTVLRGTGRVILASGISGNAAANYVPGIVISNTSVGIGTNAPAYTLDVNGTAHLTGITTLGSNLNMCNNTISNVGTLAGSTSGFTISNSSGSTIVFNTSGNITMTAGGTDPVIYANNLLNMGGCNISNVAQIQAGSRDLTITANGNMSIVANGGSGTISTNGNFDGNGKTLAQFYDIFNNGADLKLTANYGYNVILRTPGGGNIQMQTNLNMSNNNISNIGTVNAGSGQFVGAAGTGSFSIAASSGGGTLSKYGNVSFYGTFAGSGGDTNPRRVADIVGGFSGGYGWGYQFLSFNVGSGGTTANDTQMVTSEKMRILNNGNVGINQSAPAYTLDVSGSINVTGGYYVNGAALSSGSGVSIGGTTTSNYVLVATGTSSGINGAWLSLASNAATWSPGTTHTLYGDINGGSKYIQWAFNNTPGTTIADNSNINLATPGVGINQSAPVGQLHVRTAGDATVTGAGWSNNWVLITPAANSGTPANTPALGLGYNNSTGRAQIVSVAPNNGWRDLELQGGNVLLTPHDGGSIIANGTLNMCNGSITNASNLYGPGGTSILSVCNSFDVNVVAGHNLYLASPSGTYAGIYNGSSYVQIDTTQNINIGCVYTTLNTSAMFVNHTGSYANGLAFQVYNTSSGGSPVTPSSRYGSIYVGGNASSTTENGQSMVLDVGGYGGNIFGGIRQGAYGFLSLGTLNGDGANTERMRIIGTTGFVGINTTTPATTLDVNGGLTVRNGIRPPFSNVTGRAITTDPYTYGTYYYITRGIDTITIGAPGSTADSNAFWLFRNATSSYQSIVVTWPTISSTAPSPSTDTFVIPPLNSMSIMYTPSNGDYGSYSGVFNWAVF